MSLGKDRQALKEASVEFFRDYLALDIGAVDYDDALAIIEVFLDCTYNKT